MKFIIKDDNDNKIYEREACICEVSKYLSCKDCNHYHQHYTISDHPTVIPVFASTGSKRIYLSEVNMGHCVGRRSVKNAKPDDRVCEYFELKCNRR